MEYIQTPTIGEILKEEFMEPLHISSYELAKQIHVPISRIQEIISGERKVTADTSLRLARFFGVSDSYFSRLQMDVDIRNARVEKKAELEQIKQFQYA